MFGPQLFAVMLGARHAAVEATIQAFRTGAAEGQVRVSEVTIDDAAGFDELVGVIRRVRAAAGLVLVTAETLELAQARLGRLHDVAMQLRSDADLIGAFAHAVATTLVAAPADEKARATVHEMNAHLYDLGALIVSPGYGERELAPWFDNRPGGIRGDGSLTPELAGATKRHGRRVAWLAGLLARERSELAQLQL